MMMNDAVPMDENPFGGYGEFDLSTTADWTDADWERYYAETRLDMDAYDAEMENLYWEAEGDVIMAQYDEPDYF